MKTILEIMNGILLNAIILFTAITIIAVTVDVKVTAFSVFGLGVFSLVHMTFNGRTKLNYISSSKKAIIIYGIVNSILFIFFYDEVVAVILELAEKIETYLL